MDTPETTHLFCLPPSAVTLAAACVASAALGAAAVVSVVLFVGARTRKQEDKIALPPPTTTSTSTTSTTTTLSLARVDADACCPNHHDNSENAAPRCSSAFVTKKGDPFDARPRSSYLSWDDYFMALAFLSAQRSKDPNKQVGACIVSPDRIILGIGYNGFPRGCADSTLPWAKRSTSGGALATKYPYVCHAEMNAVLNKNAASVAGATMYVTMFPCNECSKLLIQAGIGEVVFYEDKQQGGARGGSGGGGSGGSGGDGSGGSTPASGGMLPSESYAASRTMLSLAGVQTRQHSPAEELVLRVSPLQGSKNKKQENGNGNGNGVADAPRRVLHVKAA